MIHGILVKDGTIKEIDLEDKLEAYYETLGCELIDIVSRKIGGVMYDIVCDDEGLYNEDSPVSMLNEEMQTPMLVGSLFICRSDKSELKSLSDDDVHRIKSKWKFGVLWGNY